MFYPNHAGHSRYNGGTTHIRTPSQTAAHLIPEGHLSKPDPSKLPKCRQVHGVAIAQTAHLVNGAVTQLLERVFLRSAARATISSAHAVRSITSVLKECSLCRIIPKKGSRDRQTAAPWV